MHCAVDAAVAIQQLLEKELDNRATLAESSYRARFDLTFSSLSLSLSLSLRVVFFLTI